MKHEHSLLYYYWFCSNNLMWCIHNVSFNSIAISKKETNLFSYSSYETFVSIRLTKDWEKYRFQYVFMEFIFSFVCCLSLRQLTSLRVMLSRNMRLNGFQWLNDDDVGGVSPTQHETWFDTVRGFTMNKMRIICIMLVEIWIFHFVHGRCSETVMKKDEGWWHHHWNLTKDILFSFPFRKCALFYPFFIIEYIKCRCFLVNVCFFVWVQFRCKTNPEATTKMER